MSTVKKLEIFAQGTVQRTVQQITHHGGRGNDNKRALNVRPVYVGKRYTYKRNGNFEKHKLSSFSLPAWQGMEREKKEMS